MKDIVKKVSQVVGVELSLMEEIIEQCDCGVDYGNVLLTSPSQVEVIYAGKKIDPNKIKLRIMKEES